jgi:hypothetical protein
MGLKGEIDFKISDGNIIKVEVEHEGGFITSIVLEGNLNTDPPDALKQLESQLKWVQLNSVAIYTRIRFFMLKYKINIPGIDLNDFSKKITEVVNNPIVETKKE